MRLLELAHVDRDDVLLAAVERLRQREGGLGLADAGRADEQEDADGLVGVLEARACRLDPPRDELERVVLTDDALPEDPCQAKHGLDLVLDHPADRDARPVRHHRRHGLLVDQRQHERVLALQRRELALDRRERFEATAPVALGGRLATRRRAT